MTKRDFIEEFDEQGNLIHYKMFINMEFEYFEFWKKYDKKGQCIYYKSNDGKELFFKYSKKGEQKDITKKEYEKLHK